MTATHTVDAVDPELDEIPRRALIDASQRTYLEFRKTLTPRWGRMWLAFLAGHLSLVIIALGIIAASGASSITDVALAVLGGIALGYVLHYLLLFQHEAAHYNLAASRAVNDLACDILIGAIVGEGIKSYRKVHLDHHRYLGTTNDTERSYFEAIDRRFILESATGIRLVRIMLDRARHTEAEGERRLGFLKPTLIAAAAINGAIVVGGLLSGRWPLSVAWTLGMLAFLPLFNSTRQVLEHRSFDADASVNYAEVDHGVVNRLFGSGPLASTLGGAGFNRHLLHHWDPGLSCTRLHDLERFLHGTAAGPALVRRRSTYLGTLRRLISR
jgi:fatty acid desaturase